MNLVILILWLLLIPYAPRVYSDELPPPPASVDFSKYTLDDVSRLIVGAMTATREAEKANLAILSANKTLSARIVVLGQELQKEEDAHEKAEDDSAILQIVIDKQDSEISDLKKMLHKWKVFGNTILVILFGATLSLTFLALKTPPVPLYARIALALIAGGLASSGLFYVITNLIQ